MRAKNLGLVALLGVMFILAAVGGLWSAVPSEAAPPAAPTPITGVVYSADGNYFPIWSLRSLSASATSDPVTLSSFEWADFQYVIDQGSPANAITLTVQFSNDRANWTSGPALATNNSADATSLTRLPLFGRYTRIQAEATGTNTVIVSVDLLAK